ncbi:MAG: hypothetical protein U5P10_16375 [Spirochaetia bacterium]|nr:hypothetical protein [Spirochaetia bacterium]
MDIKKFFDFYQENGFFFSDEILTRYCLSLHTKPFVILSGISGTGKTKIAQLFQPIINKFLIDIFSQSQTVNDDDVVINITKNMIDGGGRGNMQYRYRDNLYNERELGEIDRRIETLKKEGKEDNITKPKKIILVTEDDEKIPIQIYLQRASNPLLRIRLKSKNTDKDTFDSRSYFRTNYSVNSKLLLKKVEENTFKILSQSESTNKYFLQISNELESKKLNNQCFVSVRSDWVDATDVFGYYDSFSGKYHITKILKFIFEANENSDIPYFLIFDEMNLSKVEYYFSDVLSVMESKYLNDKGESVQEPVTLHSNPVEADDSLIEEVEKIYIPDNLYITGTVNIDETTYMFSPKVLDRANVLEFNEVDIDGYENNYSQSEEKKSDFVLNEMPVFGKASLAQEMILLKQIV